MNDNPSKWMMFIKKLSITHLLKLLLSVSFSLFLISLMVIYIYKTLEENKVQEFMNQNKVVEYVIINETDEHITDHDIDIEIEKILNFPVNYDGKTTAYILRDRTTDVKYIYIHIAGTGGGPALARYWEKEDVEEDVDKSTENTD